MSVPHLEKGCVTARDQIFRGRNLTNVCLQFDDASKIKMQENESLNRVMKVEL